VRQFTISQNSGGSENIQRHKTTRWCNAIRNAFNNAITGKAMRNCQPSAYAKAKICRPEESRGTQRVVQYRSPDCDRDLLRSGVAVDVGGSRGHSVLFSGFRFADHSRWFYSVRICMQTAGLQKEISGARIWGLLTTPGFCLWAGRCIPSTETGRSGGAGISGMAGSTSAIIVAGHCPQQPIQCMPAMPEISRAYRCAGFC